MSGKKEMIRFIQESLEKVHQIILLEEKKIQLEDKLKKLNEVDNYGYPAGADADRSAPWHEKEPRKPSKTPGKKYIDVRYHDNEIAILSDDGGNDYAFYHGNMEKSDFAEYGSVPGHWERDEDGGSLVNDLEDWELDNDAIEGYINDHWDSLTKGIGLEDWEKGIDVVKIDDALKADLIETFKGNLVKYL
jgi:hypothetical protein